MSQANSNYLVAYGPNANCTIDRSSLEYCPISASVYRYLPNLSANLTFLIFFFIAMIIQIYQGLRWRTWWFMGAMFFGCVCEILGYAGRVILWQNPFSFNGFILQIILITIGPAFFSAAIYFTISKIVISLGREYSPLPPRAYYWIFIPCDIVSLSLQGTGGGLSSGSSGVSNVAIGVSIAGLSFQVVTLCIFSAMVVDFAIRYWNAWKLSATKTILSTKFKIFSTLQSLAIIFILIRCGYRIAELKGGYTGPKSSLIRNEGLFIGLESVMIVLAAASLTVAHPGPAFAGSFTLSKGLQIGHEQREKISEQDV